MISAIVLISIREWILLLARRKIAELREMPPVWLEEYAVAESRPLNVLTLLALGFALAKELSGEAHMDRARQQQIVACACEEHQSATKSERELYDRVTKERFTGIRRCC
jgi:hypothetical protein